MTVLPVIGVPLKAVAFDGLDALMSIVQMPSGVPVASVAINGGKNAAYLALQIMGIKYPELSEKLKAFRKEQEDACLKTDQDIRERY
jgi:5-(carboxyamino)imidazole ribonucleotide mutase